MIITGRFIVRSHAPIPGAVIGRTTVSLELIDKVRHGEILPEISRGNYFTHNWLRPEGREWSRCGLMGRRNLYLEHGPLRFNFLDLVKVSAAATRADLASSLPIGWRLEVRIPKRPGSALSGTSTVDLARPLFSVEEDAIAIGEFFEALADSDLPHVFFFE